MAHKIKVLKFLPIYCSILTIYSNLLPIKASNLNKNTIKEQKREELKVNIY